MINNNQLIPTNESRSGTKLEKSCLRAALFVSNNDYPNLNASLVEVLLINTQLGIIKLNPSE